MKFLISLAPCYCEAVQSCLFVAGFFIFIKERANLVKVGNNVNSLFVFCTLPQYLLYNIFDNLVKLFYVILIALFSEVDHFNSVQQVLFTFIKRSSLQKILSKLMPR